ncbi:ABC transporter permease [Entomospira culicis]|uniref:Sugar ABC transporter permease n=1 Tax=Entomospira culicis TaxID=2719989 RepID=A0A968GJM5_9SPIO|nr:ABC transporter permease subunit [Entomospira culicis]NIZ19889.1 sugar ABC transporter permease [Entomospira culicis]NIZ70154.1 sugar ABC transporter permease [Entomospira culicis]WDI37987.1 ABC transporter permease subunit [Entomospira culicis]WDI39610.1 ABC transporter permease subunit [Entomospira culicis]
MKQQELKGLALIRKQLPLQLMVWPMVIFLIIFHYIPIYGIIIAFQDFTIFDGFFGSRWVGLEQFRAFLEDRNFWLATQNTLGINALRLVIGFPAAIILAVMVNEMRMGFFRKSTQTISYLPHFLSWVIFGGMIISWLSSTGIVNQILVGLKIIERPITFLIEPRYYWWIAVFSDIWKEVGWNTILYLAAMAGIDPTLYEAATVDGATRLQQIIKITIPSIRGIIILTFVLAMGGLFGSNLDQTLILQNSLNRSRSEVISSYVFRMGISGGDYSYATAIGLFLSLISLVLVLSTHYITKRMNDRSIF